MRGCLTLANMFTREEERLRDKELFTIIQNFRKNFITNPENAHIFYDKKQEAEEEYEQCAANAEKSSREFAAERGEQLWWFEYVYRKDQERKKLAKRDVIKYHYLWKVCRGETDYRTMDLSSARSVPISSLIGYNASRQSPTRGFYKCPFHSERSASFTWFVKQNKYHCFGCGANGDAIDFVQKMHNTDFKGALQILRRSL